MVRKISMKNFFKNSKRSIAAIVTLCILLGITGIGAYATAMSEETTIVTEGNIQELAPMMARACGSVPQSAYAMYSYIINGGDTSIYISHAYDNVSSPYLPHNTTYTTYRITYEARLVIGANGTAYYSPDHYASWIKMY